MDQLELLEQELKLLQDNIDRVKKYKKESTFHVNNCRVVGELKHRMIALKQRFSIIQNISTYDLFKE